MKPFSRKEATVALLVTSLLWSMGGMLIKLIEWHPLAITGARAFVVLLFFLAIGYRPPLLRTRSFLISAFSLALTNLTFVVGNKLTHVANVVVLQACASVYIGFLSHRTVGDRVTAFDWKVIGAVVLGVVLVFYDDIGSGNMLGNLAGAISGMGAAAYALSLRAQREKNPVDSYFWANVILVVLTAPWFLFAPVFQGDMPRLWDLPLLLILGIFQQAIPNSLYALALRSTPAIQATLITSLNYVLAIMLAFLVVGDAPAPLGLLGCGIVLAAVVARILRANEPPIG